MRIRILSVALLAVVALLNSCSREAPTGPESAQLTDRSAAAHLPVRISEIHYDNTGTDAGEAIEVSAPAGTDLTGWTLVLYNGSNGLSYTPLQTITGVVPATCGERGVVSFTYPVNGIQNGSPDGIALVNAAGTVVEFLSYEGVMTALNGPANGMTSTDILVSENGTEALGLSLQRNADDTWDAPAASTFGACNDGTTNEEPVVIDRVDITPPSATVAVGASVLLTASAFDAADAPVAGATFVWVSRSEAIATVNAGGSVTGVAAGTAYVVATAPNGVRDSALVTVEAPSGLSAVRFSEIHYDNTGADANEAIEVEGPAGTNIDGWSIVLYNQTGGVLYSTRELTGTFADQCSGRGTIYITYPADGIQNGGSDGFALIDAAGAVVEFLSYEGTLTATNGPAIGLTSTDIGVFEPSTTPIGLSLQRRPNGTWATASAATFGVCFGQTPVPPSSSIAFSGRTPSDPALPVGFEDQLFATLRDGAGTTVPTTFTWTSVTPDVASIDANGVMRALAAGTAVIRATASEGTTATYSLPTRIATASLTAVYADHAEFGEPTDGDASNDILVRRAQFISSYNPTKGTPNWVAYNLEATHFGGEDRCDCFTFDPELAASYTPYTTADYTGAGAIAGYGIDRGHLARSFDRTGGSLDNAHTFYFSNIIPQAADNNQGPWASMENHLGDLARFSDRELFIVAGVAGNKGTVKNEGRIVIPTAVWKVALILPRNAGLANVDSWDDVEVIAAIMPNDAGIRNVDWNTYRTTIDAVEALSGYDLFALLRDDVEIAVESGTRPPEAALDGPYAAYAGDPVAMSGAGSTDADGDALTYAWSFGDGATAGGASTSHTYATAGSFTVRLIVTDVLGLADTVTTTTTITTIPPRVGVDRALGFIESLAASGALSRGNANSLTSKLEAARRQIEAGNLTPVAGQLGAVLNELKAMVSTGRLTEAQAAPTVEIVQRVLDIIGG